MIHSVMAMFFRFLIPLETKTVYIHNTKHNMPRIIYVVLIAETKPAEYSFNPYFDVSTNMLSSIIPFLTRNTNVVIKDITIFKM